MPVDLGLIQRLRTVAFEHVTGLAQAYAVPPPRCSASLLCLFALPLCSASVGVITGVSVLGSNAKRSCGVSKTGGGARFHSMSVTPNRVGLELTNFDQ
jgi:hypothetical protein